MAQQPSSTGLPDAATLSVMLRRVGALVEQIPLFKMIEQNAALILDREDAPSSIRALAENPEALRATIEELSLVAQSRTLESAVESTLHFAAKHNYFMAPALPEPQGPLADLAKQIAASNAFHTAGSTARPSARKRPAYCSSTRIRARSSRRRQPGAFRGSRRVAASRGDPDDGDPDPAGLAAPAGDAARSHETCPHCGRVLLWAWAYGKPALVCVRRGCGQP